MRLLIRLIITISLLFPALLLGIQQATKKENQNEEDEV